MSDEQKDDTTDAWVLAERLGPAIMAERARFRKDFDKLTRRITDRDYMLRAYRNMLGPKGLEVAAMWEAQGITRVHYDWTSEGAGLSGEERAAMILEAEAAPKRLMLPGEIDGITSPTPEPTK